MWVVKLPQPVSNSYLQKGDVLYEGGEFYRFICAVPSKLEGQGRFDENRWRYYITFQMPIEGTFAQTGVVEEDEIETADDYAARDESRKKKLAALQARRGKNKKGTATPPKVNPPEE